MDERYINYLLAKIVVLTHERDRMLGWSENALAIIDPNASSQIYDTLRRTLRETRE